ncbi:MAG TPA: FecR domain-containing protein [Puia sp.]|jgi:ferric-dicitrate binding protein FerR (iron transport regulator)
MDKHYLIELLHKYIEGTATETERQLIERYYNLFESEPDVLSLLTAAQKNELRTSLPADIWKTIEIEENEVRRKTSVVMWRIGMAVAAAMILVIVKGLFLTSPTSRTAPLAAIHGLKKGNHVICLPDGTTVTLSAASSLSYSPAFTSESKREVFLEGQAFFDVHRDSLKPFLVHAGKVNVTVLGTAFNVKANTADDSITVTVKRGKVRVNDPETTLGTITPRQQVVYNKQNQRSSQGTVKSDSYLDWRNDDCFCDNLTMMEVIAILEDRFNVSISVDEQVAGADRFTATFSRLETLDQALKSICEFNGAIYQYDRQKAVVVIKQK